LYIKKLTTGSTIDFGGRSSDGSSWSPFYTTKSSNFQIITLVNGSVIPRVFSATTSATLLPYVDASGKVKIGPMSAIVLMELGETNHNKSCFDYMDQALLITFTSKHPNNGHGNNLDGVDSSNPGRGSGGPNGAIDPSAGVDDESK
jgi:hypothetical protein